MYTLYDEHNIYCDPTVSHLYIYIYIFTAKKKERMVVMVRVIGLGSWELHLDTWTRLHQRLVHGHRSADMPCSHGTCLPYPRLPSAHPALEHYL